MEHKGAEYLYAMCFSFLLGAFGFLVGTIFFSYLLRDYRERSLKAYNLVFVHGFLSVTVALVWIFIMPQLTEVIGDGGISRENSVLVLFFDKFLFMGLEALMFLNYILALYDKGPIHFPVFNSDSYLIKEANEWFFSSKKRPV